MFTFLLLTPLGAGLLAPGSPEAASWTRSCISDLFLITGRGNARLHVAQLLVTPPKTMLFWIPSPLEGLLSRLELLGLG